MTCKHEIIEAMDRNMSSFRAAKEITFEIDGQQHRLSDLVWPFTVQPPKGADQ